jgi:hypothetical protein
MKTINKQPDNMGGVIKLWAIPKNAISLQDNVPTILSDADIVSCYIVPDTTSSTSDQSTTFAGTTFKHTISGLVPGFSAATIAIIGQMVRQLRYVVIYMDGDGQIVLLGRPEIPLMFDSKFTTGQTTSNLKHFKISFAGNVHYPPLLLNSNPFSD